MELKAQIISTANLLIELLESCQDEELVDSVVDAIRYNDKEPLWELEDKLEVMVGEEYDT
jgi:hypothetical protein